MRVPKGRLRANAEIRALNFLITNSYGNTHALATDLPPQNRCNTIWSFRLSFPRGFYQLISTLTLTDGGRFLNIKEGASPHKQVTSKTTGQIHDGQGNGPDACSIIKNASLYSRYSRFSFQTCAGLAEKCNAKDKCVETSSYQCKS